MTKVDERALRRALPRRVWARLTVQGWITTLGCWLVEHGHTEAAVWLWRVCRMW